MSIDFFEEVDEGRVVLERDTDPSELGSDEAEEDDEGAGTIIKCCIFERDLGGVDEEA